MYIIIWFVPFGASRCKVHSARSLHFKQIDSLWSQTQYIFKSLGICTVDFKWL